MVNGLGMAGWLEGNRTWAGWWLAVVSYLAAQGCGGYSYMIPQDSYVITGRNYTYAIYNSANRLMTHPLEDLLVQIQKRKTAGEPDITDVYVVSHGWNFTPDEAAANYHNYIELIDHAMRHPSVNPYFIFVTWLSTTRPTTELASAVLPFNIDGALRPVTYAVDNYPLHLLTAWKQSLNAAANGLGHAYPQTYLLKPWRRAAEGCRKEYGTGVSYEGDKGIGQDLPVSGMLFALVSAKMALTLNKPDYSRLLHCLPVQAKDGAHVKETLKEIKVHLVGHSYGAKLVAFAGMEAIRRWVVTDKLGFTADELDPPLKRADEKQQEWMVAYDDRMKKVLDDTGHEAGNVVTLTPGIFNPDEDKVKRAVDEVYDALVKAGGVAPIESLIMINPAMHPGEFWYPIDWLHKAPAGTLRLIPRKAILYSKYDYPNGTIYSLRESFMSTQIAQWWHSLQANTSEVYGDKPFPVNVVGDMFIGSVYGTFSLVSSVVQGALLYAFTSVANLPADLYHHVTENDFGKSWNKPTESGALAGFSKGALNFVDYFVPIYPFFMGRDEDKQGLLRLARPALGKGGLTKIAAGRWWRTLNLWGLKQFDTASVDIEPQKTCRFTTERKSPLGAVDAGVTRNQIYSFDASLVYDTANPPEGSHGDVRSREATSCPNEEFPGIEVPLRRQKRYHSFNFVFNFTKTDFVKTL